MSDWKPNIYEYVNYRDYLRQYYESGKEHRSAFSYRFLARRAGFSSPNYYKLVMDGDRNIGPDSIEKFADALDLTDEERRFFADLVAFNQAEDVDERNEAFERIAARRRFRKARRIDQSMFEYLSHWYHPAIRELAARPDFEADAEWIGARLSPSVPTDKIADSLDLLFDMQLLVRDEKGEIHRGDPSLTTGHEVGSLAIGNFHRQMIERASESIESFDSEVRDISALTVCIDVAMVDDLKDRIHAFREKLLHLADDTDNPEAVYQMNVQLFPLTNPEDSEDKT